MAKPCFILLWLLATALSGANLLADEKTDNSQIKTGRFVYKDTPRRTLTVYYPDDWKATDQRSALVIFRCRIPVQREYFRKRGMVIVKPQLAAVNSGKLPSQSLEEIAELPRPRHQVEDAKSVIRYLRKNAGRLGIAADKIVATGTSGGGDLALQACINRAFEDAADDRSVSSRPNALVLYCPAFDGIDIWYVKREALLKETKSQAPSFLPLLDRFIKNTSDQYATPLDHRANLIQLAATLGKEKQIDGGQIAKFQEILKQFNERDWQLLHPPEEALKMSASRILTREPLPPTLIMFGERDHLYEHQKAFVEKARSLGQKFTLKIYPHGGHSFMLQPAFLEPSTDEVETFLRTWDYLPKE